MKTLTVGIIIILYVFLIGWKICKIHSKKPSMKQEVISTNQHGFSGYFQDSDEKWSYRIVCKCPNGNIIEGPWRKDRMLAWSWSEYSNSNYPELNCKVEVDYGPPKANRIAW
jgi:hypothetical protein